MARLLKSTEIFKRKVSRQGEVACFLSSVAGPVFMEDGHL